jgi:type I restriction enzyme S subunit
VNDWPVRPLRALAEVALGRQRAPQHEQGPHLVPYMRAANVSDGRLNLDDVKEMNFTPSEQLVFALRPGDVLVTEGSGSLGTVGASAVWQGEIHGTVCFQNTLLRLRPRDGQTDPRFLAWWSRATFADGIYASIASGANIFHLSADRVRALPLHSPPLDEQRRIADFLDTESARIDSLVEKKRMIIALLDERIQAIINEVTPGPVVLGKDGRPIGIEDMTCVRLGAVATIHGGFTMDDGRETGPDAVTMPYLRVANVLDGSLALEDVKEVTLPRLMAERCTLRPGDVLMTEGGDPDKLGRGTVWSGDFGPCLHQNAIFAVRPDSRLLPEYLALMTRTRYARVYFEVTASKSTGIAHTSSTKISGFHVPLPPIREQRRVCAAVNEAVARINSLREPTLRQLTLLTERRQTLIAAAVMGGTTV